MAGNFSGSGVQAPAAHALDVTPADADLSIVAAGHFTRAVYVGGVGDLAVRMADNGDQGDQDVIFKAVPAGSILPIRVSQIQSTGTSATLIIALW